MKDLIKSKRWAGRCLVLGVMVVCIGVFSGCCTIGDHTLVIQNIVDEQTTGDDTEAVVQHTTCPDDSVELKVWSGQTITFVNATGKECTVRGNSGVYTKSHVFTIASHKCKKRKIDNLPIDKIISNEIKCEDDGHGTPRMIVVKNPNDE